MYFISFVILIQVLQCHPSLFLIKCNVNSITPFGDSGSELYFIVCCYISHIIVTNSSSAVKRSIGFTIGFHNHGVSPFQGLLLVESAFTFKTLLRHYAKRTLTLVGAFSVNVQLRRLIVCSIIEYFNKALRNKCIQVSNQHHINYNLKLSHNIRNCSSVITLSQSCVRLLLLCDHGSIDRYICWMK